MTFRVCIDTPKGRRYSPRVDVLHYDKGGIDDGLTCNPAHADEFPTLMEALEDVEDYGDPSRAYVVQVLPDGGEVRVRVPPMNTCAACFQRRTVDKDLAARFEKMEAALKWYGWPDRHVPRFEGVGRIGIGAKYWPQVESDLGRLAREALGEKACGEAYYSHVDEHDRAARLAVDVEQSKALIQKTRQDVGHITSLVIHWKHGGGDAAETLNLIAKTLDVL